MFYIVLLFVGVLLLVHALRIKKCMFQKNVKEIYFEKGRLFYYLSSLSLLSFGLTIFVPWNIYFGNIVHFTFILADFALYSLMEFLILVVLGWLVLQLIPPSVGDFAVSVVAGLGLSVYVQSMFMNKFLKEMDGLEPEWSQHYLWAIINVAIWIIIVFAPILLKKWIPSYKTIVSMMASAFLVLEFVSMVSLVVTAPEFAWERKNPCFIVDGTKQFHLSENKNIVVFIFDALGTGYLEYCFSSDPETKDVLKDFIWYHDARSNYAQTFPGVAHELTGALIYPAKNRKEMFNRIWHSKSAESFYQQIKNAGFDSRIYIDGTSHGTPDIYADRFSNVMETDISYNVEKKELLKKIINVSLFSAVPYICKRFFMYDAASINEHVTSSIHSNPRIALPHNNASFYKKMIASGITIDGDSPVLAFYYTSGVHAPFRINEKCEMVATPFKDPLPTIKSCLFIVSEFIRMLKEKNIYDNTAIFICSDHGSHGLSRNTPYDMSFILKPFNQNNSSIIIDESKVQSIDIIPLLLQLACGSKSDCSSFEGFPPSQVPADRERIVRLLTVHPDIPAFMEDYSGKTKFQYNAEKVFLFSDADSFMKRDFSPRVQADGANSAFLRYVPLNSKAVVDETILLEPLPWNDRVGRRTIWTRRLKRLFK